MRRSGTFFLPAGRILVLSSSLLAVVICLGCDNSQTLTADMPFHLEEHLDDATIIGSEVPADLIQPVEWRFDVPQPDWKATPPRPFPPTIRPATVSQTHDALQITLGPSTAIRRTWLGGGAHVDVPEWDHRDWAHVIIRARSSGPGDIELGFNIWDREGHPNEGRPVPYEMMGRGRARLVGDSTVQTYQLQMEPEGPWEEPIKQLGLWISADEPLTVEILSTTAVPMEALYAEEPAGVSHVDRDSRYRRSLFVHTPAQVEYRVQVPAGGRLDTGLGTAWSDPPTTFRVTVRADGEPAETLLEESHGDRGIWAQHSVDLSAYAGQVVTLSLEAESERAGSVALWGAPTLTGPRTTDIPNVIFYIIDGAGAEYMSLYGYNRRTTPNIDRLAAEGALFERAYSNSTYTKASTASFMTSLQTSVLGELTGFGNALPDKALTMAQHFHGAGYQTAVLTANPNAGTGRGLQRGVDWFQEGWGEFAYGGAQHHRESSKYLHESFWNWREEYPGEPYWVHFQTVDIHNDFPEVAPFGGLFVSAAEVQTWDEWSERLSEFGGAPPYSPAWEETGLSRPAYWSIKQGLYDEAMAHNDYQLGRLVERLKAEGEWENTLLIVAADHSVKAAMNDLVIAIRDSLPPGWEAPMFRPSISRVPLLFVWPGHIAGGQRFSQPVVSMIDVLPTILDLVGLPLPEVMQGQSLAPVLLGEGNVEPRPVILDQFDVDRETGEFRGIIEVIDGRWGASLEINPWPSQSPEGQRPVPLLLYDLWNDPMCLHSVHEEHPDLVEKYTAFLEAQFEAHLALGQLFTPSEPVPLTPEQLEMLRALGYIR
ncbi:MAG: sulfatase [Gemmatimonadota bacterium]